MVAAKPLVATEPEKCRVCYTCVRECPAKAIKIIDGQAEIVHAKCIGCGNCVKVCSQKAKVIRSSIDSVKDLLKKQIPCAAIIAPSFPADFYEYTPENLVKSLRQLGFRYVVEVAFGADIVAPLYKKLVGKKITTPYISTTCPAIVSYVEKYHPELINYLAPIVSPMIATARALRRIYGEKLKVVFIGPCIAKKAEIERKEFRNDITHVLTFGELRELFKLCKISPEKSGESKFDEPLAGKGSLFPIGRGMFEAANIKEDLISCNIMMAEGKNNFIEAIKEFSAGYIKTKLLEILCCEGCIMGPGTSQNIPLYKKKYLVSNYVRKKLENFNHEKHKKMLEACKGLNLCCSFHAENEIRPSPLNNDISEVLSKLGKNKIEDELNCGACGYQTCKEHAIAILEGYAESEMCLPYTIEKLKETIGKLENSYSELKTIKETLNHREKLASMGQLAAGIAHEINNPLGIVLMFAHMLTEQYSNVDERMKEDFQIIIQQADRCKKIVSGLLNFARQNRLMLDEVNLEGLVQNCIHALRIPGGISINSFNEISDTTCELDKEQISQAIINILNNAIDASVTGQSIQIIINGNIEDINLEIKDHGQGIPEKHIEHVFDPFFTTKQLGKGTGLGLAVVYGIIKMHSGSIQIISNAQPEKGPTGTMVRITIPRKQIKRN